VDTWRAGPAPDDRLQDGIAGGDALSIDPGTCGPAKAPPPAQRLVLLRCCA
jgi:hypothetical protein